MEGIIMNMKKWQLMKSDEILSTPWLTISKNQYEIGDGNTLDDYYVIQRSDFVLAVALENNKLLLVRQYRPATDRFYISLPAGYLRREESPELAAKRELLEETGFNATTCTLIGELHPLSGYIKSTAYIVLCEGLRADTDDIDHMEIDEVMRLDWNNVLQMIVSGEINEMQAVSAILLAKEILANRSNQ
jgi:ADP-ribose pyrophosphatase